MSAKLKIFFRVLMGIFVVLVLAWLAAAYYINHNNKTILSQLLNQLNARVNGKIEIESMETTLLKGFPGVSVALKNVQLRDSLYSIHRHELLRAAGIDISLNILSLLAGRIKINKMAVNQATVYLYTDSTGYSNTSIFKRKNAYKPASLKEQQAIEIRKVSFNQVGLVIDNKKRAKLFHFLVDEVDGRIDYPDSGWNGKIKLKTRLKNFAFNTGKGSFLKDNVIQGTIIAHYNNESQVVTIDQHRLNISNHPFLIGAKIDLSKNESAFAVDIRADQILYQDVARLLSPNISVKLLKFAIEKPIDVIGQIVDNGLKSSRDPLVNVRINVKKNTVTLPSVQLTNCSFTGTFTNRDTISKAIGDENSAIRFYHLTGDYYGAPLKIDTFSITNLARPIAAGLISSRFPLEKLNTSLGGETFQFSKGTADLKLYCKMDIENYRFTKPVVAGNVAIKNADITYLPRNLKLQNSELSLQFNRKDLHITNSRFQLGKSILYMNCAIENFLNLYYSDPSKMLVSLNLSSPQVNLSEFLFLLGPRKKAKQKSDTKNPVKAVSEQLNRVLEAARVNIGLHVNKAIYNRFVASNLNTAIALFNDGIYINRLKVSHASGSLNLKGNIKQEGNINKFSINTTISQVNVKEFFSAFENFGQNTITNQNLKGYLSAKIKASGAITSQGNMVKRSMYGQVIFNLRDAALVGFEPLRKIGRFAFPNRDFSNITLDNLDGTLTLNGDKINISPMQVNTSALNLNMKGIYSLTTGTDIAMDIPLRNPERDKNNTAAQKKLNRMKGIVLHLKAVDDGKGGIRIRWNRNRD